MIHELPEDRLDRGAAGDPRWNVALEASAGTGKTRVLVDRYIRLVEEGADPRHILAITFTRKAAGEMKSRIIDELRQNESLWAYVRERLFDIHIATIDAFCLGLLKEFPLEAGLDPDIDLLDEVDVERLTEQAIDDVLADATTPRTPDLAFLISVFGETALRHGIRDFLRGRLVKKEALSRFVARFVPRDLELESALRHRARGLADALGGTDGLDELLACGPRPSHPKLTPLTFSLERAIDPDRAQPLDLDQVAECFLTREGSPRKKLSLFTKDDFGNRADYQHYRDLILARAPAVAEVYRRWTSDRDRIAVRELWRLYRQVLDRFSELKDAHRGLDFTDVLVRAVELLEKRGEFSQSRFRLDSRYHHILIDEFQDTNKYQWRLVTALVESWGEGAGLVQDAILAEQASGRGRGLLREPTLFIVGDRKQSIYGWRDARVEVMEHAARHIERLMPGRGKRLRLRQSFRAHGSLLAFLNDVFTQMPQVRDELDWTFRYRAGDHFPVGDLLERETRIGLAVAPELAQVANQVADEIVRLLDKEHYQPKDVAILFRSRTHYRAYEKALAERGVPTYVYRGLGFFDSPEVRDIQALVRFLAEPGSELRAAELARSRFIMLSDTGLALLASTRKAPERVAPISSWLTGRLDVTELSFASPDEDRLVLLRAQTSVPGWIQKVDRTSPADLIQTVLHETDYAAYFSDRKSGRQGWENLKKILELVRRAQNRGYLTMSRLAEYLESASSGEESVAVLEAVDAVSLMTIHAAKGLEFDATFVVNLDQKTRTDTSLPRITELAGDEVEIHALDRPELQGPQRNVEEEKRLLYVALTRARKYLVLSAANLDESEGKTTLFHLLPESLRDIFRRALSTEESELVWEPTATKHRLRVLRPESEPRRYRASDEVPEYRLALEPLENPSACRMTVSGLVQEERGVAVNPWALDPIDLAVGAAVHRMFDYQVPLESLEDTALALLPNLSGHPPHERRWAAQKAADLYMRLHEQPELQRLLHEGEGYREVSFAFRREGRLIYGAMDSLVLLAGRAVVIDYKTGNARPEHRLQMELYLHAAQALFPDRETEGLIFYPLGDPLRVRLPEAGVVGLSQLDLF